MDRNLPPGVTPEMIDEQCAEICDECGGDLDADLVCHTPHCERFMVNLEEEAGKAADREYDARKDDEICP